MTGVIVNADVSYKRVAAVNPIARHYEEPDEKPYIKYICPVCYAVGNKQAGLAKGQEACSFCGVKLNWDRKPEIGDEVIILRDSGRFPADTVCIIQSEMSGDEPLYSLRKKACLTGTEYWYTQDDFSILED